MKEALLATVIDEYATVEAFYESDTAELRAALLARELVYPVPRDLLPPWLFGANASR